MPININQLRSFYTAAKHQSISEAASELMVTPAAITSQVKLLEENIGLKLLFRSGNSMRLTDSGQEVYGKVQEIFEAIDQLEVFISDISKGKTGRLRIGCSETAAIYVIPELLAAFQVEYPEIRVVIDRGTTFEMIRSLLDRKIDLLVAHYRANENRLKMRYMGKKKIVLVAAMQSTLIKQNSMLISDLEKIPLIMPAKGSATRKIVQDYLRWHKVTPKVAMETSSIALTKTLVQQDEGVSFICRQGVEEEIHQGKLKEIHVGDPIPDIQYGVGYLNRNDLSEASLSFIRVIEKFKQDDGRQEKKSDSTYQTKA